MSNEIQGSVQGDASVQPASAGAPREAESTHPASAEPQAEGTSEAVPAPVQEPKPESPPAVAIAAQTTPAAASGPMSGPLSAHQPGIAAPQAASAPRVQEIRVPWRENDLSAVLPRRSRARRFGLATVGLAVALGLGWVGGMNMHRLAEVDEASAWLQQAAMDSVHALGSGFEFVRKEIVAKAESLGHRTASSEGAGQDPASGMANAIEASDRAMADLQTRLDQARDRSEGAIHDLTTKIEGLRESADQRSQELVSRLSRLEERLGQLERQVATSSVLSKTAQPAGQASTPPTQAPAAPAIGPVAGPETRAPKPAPDRATQTTEPRLVKNWTVREVVAGTALVEGPNGIVRVSRGDRVPGVGWVESVQRRDNGWVVVTNNGTIAMNRPAAPKPVQRRVTSDLDPD